MRPVSLLLVGIAALLAGCTAPATGQAAVGGSDTVGNLEYQPPAGFAMQEDGPESSRATIWTADGPALIAVTATPVQRNSSPEALLDNFAQAWDPHIFLSAVPTARWTSTELRSTTVGGTRWVAANATALTGADSLDNASIAVYGTADPDYIYAVALITERGELDPWYGSFRRSVANATVPD